MNNVPLINHAVGNARTAWYLQLMVTSLSLQTVVFSGGAIMFTTACTDVRTYVNRTTKMQMVSSERFTKVKKQGISINLLKLNPYFGLISHHLVHIKIQLSGRFNTFIE